jgi:hypothetical protein
MVEIGRHKDNEQAYKKSASEFIDELYAFEFTNVLFKPTKAKDKQFRTDKKAAISYFIAGDDNYSEDIGFALTPWKEVRFAEDLHMILDEDRALAMGNYFFIDYDGNEVKVEYSFGYKLYQGKLKIDLHHSSLPFSG